MPLLVMVRASSWACAAGNRPSVRPAPKAKRHAMPPPTCVNIARTRMNTLPGAAQIASELPRRQVRGWPLRAGHPPSKQAPILRLHPQQAPASPVHRECSLIAEQIVARNLARSARSILQDDIEMIVHSHTLLRATKFRLSIVADKLRGNGPCNVGFTLPNVAMHLEYARAIDAAGADQAEAHRRADFCGEHGRGWIAANLTVRHCIGKIDIAGALQARARVEAQADPHRLASVVDCHVAGVLGVLLTTANGAGFERWRRWRCRRIWYADTRFSRLDRLTLDRADGGVVGVPQIDATLGEDHEL